MFCPERFNDWNSGMGLFRHSVDCGGSRVRGAPDPGRAGCTQLSSGQECLGRGQNAFLSFDARVETSDSAGGRPRALLLSDRSDNRDPLSILFLVIQNASAKSLCDFVRQQVAMIPKEFFFDSLPRRPIFEQRMRRLIFRRESKRTSKWPRAEEASSTCGAVKSSIRSTWKGCAT